MRRLLVVLVALVAAAVPVLAHAADPVSCGDLQTKLDDTSVSAITLAAGGGLCTGTYFTASDHAVTITGENGAGFKATTPNRSLTGGDANLTLTNLIFEGRTDPQPAPRAGARRDTPDTVGGGLDFFGAGTLNVDTVIFRDIRWYDSGGGLRTGNFTGPLPTVAIKKTSFLRNAAGSVDSGGNFNGGGARVEATTATVTDSIFTENQAAASGGGLALSLRRPVEGGAAPTGPLATLTGNVFTSNRAGLESDFNTSGDGGGLYVGDLTDDCGNCARPANRAAASPLAYPITVAHNTYDSNSSRQFNFGINRGGGAYYDRVQVTATATETYLENGVESGRFASGGGFYVFSSGNAIGSYTGVNTVLLGNEATGDDNGETTGTATGAGAGFGANQNGSGTLTLVHPTIIHNRVFNDDEPNGVVGPALWGTQPDTVHVDRGLIFDNTAEVADPPEVPPSRRAVVDVAEVDGWGTRDVKQSLYCDVEPPAATNFCATPVFVSDTSAEQASTSPSIDRVGPQQSGDVLVDYQGEHRPSTATAPRAQRVNAATPWDAGADEYIFPPLVTATPTPTQTSTPTPTPTQTSTPTPTQTAAPTQTSTPQPTATATRTPEPGGGVKDDNNSGKNRRCAGLRRFKIHLRRRHNVTWVDAVFHLESKRLKTMHFGPGLVGTIVDLRKLPKLTIVLRIKAVDSTGRVVRGKRVYHPCTKRIPHIPKL